MKNLNLVIALLAVLFVTGCAGPEVRLAKISRDASAAGRKHDLETLNKLSASIKPEALTQERLRGFSDKAVNNLYDALLTIALYLPDEEAYALRLESAFMKRSEEGNMPGTK